MYSLGPSGPAAFPALPGLPGSSTDLSLRAVPNHPGRSGECLLIASPPITGFIILGRLAPSTSVTRPNRVHLRYGSQVRFPGFRQTDYSCPAPVQLHVRTSNLHGELLSVHKIKPGLAWYSQDAKIAKERKGMPA